MKKIIIINIKYYIDFWHVIKDENKVDLMNIKPNMMGMTELDAVEIIHTVASSSGPNVSYIVTENVGGVRDAWNCTCPAFMYSKTTPQTCKHIIQIK